METRPVGVTEPDWYDDELHKETTEEGRGWGEVAALSLACSRQVWLVMKD